MKWPSYFEELEERRKLKSRLAEYDRESAKRRWEIELAIHKYLVEKDKLLEGKQ